MDIGGVLEFTSFTRGGSIEFFGCEQLILLISMCDGHVCDGEKVKEDKKSLPSRVTGPRADDTSIRDA